ncbi:hypothetical protein LTR49_027411 [Elasticomyces elasticus]|nr:hypothetical protein LTR49_027411 [Elasticomyces elasticus]
MAPSFFHQAAYFMLVLSLITGSFCQTSTITIDGVATAVYSSTPVGTNPQGIPTLLYNCAKLPAICNNVNSAYPLSPTVVSATTYRSIPTASQGYYEFNLDKDTVRKNRRRRLSCPANWKSSHTCPEPDQPPVVGAGKSVSDGFVGSLLEPGISYQIADQEGVNTGMAWTCDEFPAAIWVGVVVTQDIPEVSKTFKGLHIPFFAQVTPVQARCWSTDGQQLKISPNPTGIYTFHFATMFDDRDATWATAIQWYNANGEEDQTSYRRSLSSPTAFRALVLSMLMLCLWIMGFLVALAMLVPLVTWLRSSRPAIVDSVTGTLEMADLTSSFGIGTNPSGYQKTTPPLFRRLQRL